MRLLHFTNYTVSHIFVSVLEQTMAASFVARAVVDEVLSPAFLSEQNNDRPGDIVVEKSITLLNREHCNARLERVWGPGDGRPVEELKKDMDQLLQEYILSRELDEAARCVKELDASHFHHELVKRGVFIDRFDHHGFNRVLKRMRHADHQRQIGFMHRLLRE